MSYNDVSNHMVIPTSRWIDFVTQRSWPVFVTPTRNFEKNKFRSVDLVEYPSAKKTPFVSNLFAKELPKGPTRMIATISKRDFSYTITNYKLSEEQLAELQAFVDTEGPIWDTYVLDTLRYLTTLSFRDQLTLRQYQGPAGYQLLNSYLRGTPIETIRTRVYEDYIQFLQNRIRKTKTKKAIINFLSLEPFILAAQYKETPEFQFHRKLATLSVAKVRRLVTTQKLDELASDLNRIINGAPKLPSDIFVYRGLREIKPLRGPLKGFTSVTTNLNIAFNFTKEDYACCIDIYKLSKGHAAFILFMEDEIILPTTARRRKISNDPTLIAYIMKAYSQGSTMSPAMKPESITSYTLSNN